MLDAFWYNIKFTGVEDNIAFPKLDSYFAGQNQKEIISFRVGMPDEFALYFDNHYVIAVKLRDDLGRPKFGKFGKFG